MSTLRLGTRASLLATTQSQWVADRVTQATGRAVELVPIVSQGDVLTGSLASLGGTGVFASALRDALLRGECDFIVHSLKDLPTAAVPGLTLTAVPERERANDVLCSVRFDSLAAMPAGARVGTGSPRRAAQLLRARPDLTVLDIRGNVDTRLGKVAAGDYDAIVLAQAGLRRIGRDNQIREVFDLATHPSSAGQGALAIEARSDDPEVNTLLDAVNDPATARAARLERAVLARLEAGCAAPVGISVLSVAGAQHLLAEVYSLDGQQAIRAERRLAEPTADPQLAADVVTELLAGGAAEIAPLTGGSRAE